MTPAFAMNKVSLQTLVFLACIGMPFAFVGKVHAAPNTDSMLGYWKFDGNGSDSSGDGSTASMAGVTSPSYDTQVPDVSFAFPNTRDIQFYGANSSVSFAGQPGLRPTSALTVSFWLNFSAIPTGFQIVGNSLASYPNQGFDIQATSSSLIFRVGNGSTSAATNFSVTDISVTAWHLVTATWDGSTAKLFLDGVEKSSTATQAGAISYATGSVFSAGYFNGKMDDLRLYKRALSLGEIQDLYAGRHTVAIWTGAASSDYGTPENWNIIAVPDPYTRVTVPNVSVKPRLGAGEYLAGLTIGTGSSLDLKGDNLTFNDAAVFSNKGSLLLDNAQNQLLQNFVNDTANGTVVINNTANVNNFATGSSYHNLTLGGTANINLTAALVVHGALTVNGGMLSLSGMNVTVGSDLALNGGTINGSTGTVSVAGDWRQVGGTFNCGTGVVVLNGSGQTVTGSNTFHDLSKTVSGTDTADVLTFGAGDTQTITNALTLNGVSTASPLSLRSTVPGTRWRIDPQGTTDFAYLDVRDSDGVGSKPIDVTGLTVANGSNDVHWVFDHSAPTIVLDAFDSTTTDERESVSGVATESSSTVALVEFQVDSITGRWSSCVADDGSFDASSERFTCTPSSDLGHAKHVYYFRATDADGYVSTGDFVAVTIRIEAKNDDSGSGGGSDSSDSGSATTVVSDAAPSTSVPTTVTDVPSDASRDAVVSGSGSAPADVLLKAENVGQTTTDWQAQFFGNADCPDQSVCGNLADPDADGLTNAQEYLLGTDPNDADTNNNGVKDSAEYEEGSNPITGDRITYESPKNHGKEDDVLNVDNVEAVDGGVKNLRFSGRGLPNSYVVLYIYSDLPTILTVKTDANGNWSYTLDKELGNGDHQVYVGVTDNNGKVIAKSQPLAFVKTAEAITIIPSAQAATESVSKKNTANYVAYTVVISSVGALVALTTIGLIVKKNRRKSEKPDDSTIRTAL